MQKKVLAAAIVMSLLGTESLAASLEWTTYEDVQFGCVLDYPAGLFNPDAPTPDEPRRFSSSDTEVYFRMQGVANASGWSPQAIKEKYLAANMPGDVTYDRTRSDFVVLSGYRGPNIFYTKVAVSDDRNTACILEITYPRSQKGAFDPIVTRMSRSFRSVD